MLFLPCPHLPLSIQATRVVVSNTLGSSRNCYNCVWNVLYHAGVCLSMMATPHIPPFQLFRKYSVTILSLSDWATGAYIQCHFALPRSVNISYGFMVLSVGSYSVLWFSSLQTAFHFSMFRYSSVILTGF